MQKTEGTGDLNLIEVFSSVQQKPLFWFRSNTETETQIGRYF